MKKALGIASLLLLALVLLLGWRILSTSDKYAESTVVENIQIGGLTRTDAAGMLGKIRPQTIRVEYQGEEIKLPASALWQKRAQTLRQIPRPSLWQRIIGSGSGRYKMIWGYQSKDLQNLYRDVLRLEKSPSSAKWIWNGKWKIVKEKQGFQINRKDLWNNILLAARAGGGEIALTGKSTKPDLTTKELRQDQPTQLLVDQSDYKLYVYRQGRLRRTYNVAVGAPGFETPNGNWTILQRAVDPAWLPPDWAGEQAGILVPGGTPENPLVARWMGIGDGIGIHGTRDIWSLGSAASHGCIRMDPEEVKELYEIVPIGTPFRIQA